MVAFSINSLENAGVLCNWVICYYPVIQALDLQKCNRTTVFNLPCYRSEIQETDDLKSHVSNVVEVSLSFKLLHISGILSHILRTE